MKRNLELLRKFDLEAAKKGELLTSPASVVNGEPMWEYVAGPDSIGEYIMKILDCGEFSNPAPAESFRMAPLGWIGERPVYAGDKLYHPAVPKSEYVVGGVNADGEFLVVDRCAPISSGNGGLTFTKPTTKRSGWINLYRRGGCPITKYSMVYGSETLAKNSINDSREYLATAEIHWEE